MAIKKKVAAKRTPLVPEGDKRYVRRDAQRRFDESDDVGRSLAADVRKPARKQVPAGQGDRGDQNRRR